MWFDDGFVCIGGDSGFACFPWQDFTLYAVAAVLMLAVVLGVLVWDARRTATPSQAARRANRHATLASLVGVALLLVVLFWLAVASLFGAWGSGGRVLALLPILAGACLLAAQAVGQLTWPRPSGSHREAELTPRTVGDVAPTWPRRLVLVWAVASLVLLGVFALVADGPRSLTRPAGAYMESIGPYPGWYYGVPMALAVVATVGATELVLRLVAGRSAVAGVSAGWDLHLRRRSAAHVTRGIQFVLGVTVAGILVVAGQAHLTLGRDAVWLRSGQFAVEGSPAQHTLGTLLLASAACVLLVALSGLVLPRRLRRPREAVPAEATVAA